MVESPEVALACTRDLYLDLLKRLLTRTVAPERYQPLRIHNVNRYLYRLALPVIQHVLDRKSLVLMRPCDYDPAIRGEGKDWPL